MLIVFLLVIIVEPTAALSRNILLLNRQSLKGKSYKLSASPTGQPRNLGTTLPTIPAQSPLDAGMPLSDRTYEAGGYDSIGDGPGPLVLNRTASEGGRRQYPEGTKPAGQAGGSFYTDPNNRNGLVRAKKSKDSHTPNSPQQTPRTIGASVSVTTVEGAFDADRIN